MMPPAAPRSKFRVTWILPSSVQCIAGTPFPFLLVRGKYGVTLVLRGLFPGDNTGQSPLAGNRVGGGLAAPVLPHHRTYSAYPAVSSTVSTGATTRQGSFPFRHRGRWLLLAHPSSGSAFTRDAGAHGLLPPFKKEE